MKQRKKLQELTIKDSFMFGAVMVNEELCKEFLELALGFPIERVMVSKEKSIVYHPEYKGVRLDVYAKDEKHTHYNVEMQMWRKPAPGKRSRYYHSQIDMELLLSGMEYHALPDAYVIFICDFDPFGKEKYCYTFDQVCKEDGSVLLEDGSHTLFFSTYGRNEDEVPEALVKFLKYVKADLVKSSEDYEDDFVRKLQETVREIKASREMEGRYMLLEELIQDERKEAKAEGKAEAVLDLLEDMGKVPENLRMMIANEQDPEVLKTYLRKAAAAQSIEEAGKLILG